MSIHDFLFLFACLKNDQKTKLGLWYNLWRKYFSANVILCCSVAACFHVVALLSCYLCPLGDKDIVCQGLDAAGLGVGGSSFVFQDRDNAL